MCTKILLFKSYEIEVRPRVCPRHLLFVGGESLLSGIIISHYSHLNPCWLFCEFEYLQQLEYRGGPLQVHGLEQLDSLFLAYVKQTKPRRKF
jgi:hypothetical protein